MEPVTTIHGHVTVLDRADVDTDQIIPKQFLKRIERTGYGEFLFFDWVRSGEVSIEPGAVLVAGRNFGCGSSREHAVWAIQQFGFDAVIATSSTRTAPRMGCSRSCFPRTRCARLQPPAM